MVYDLKLGVLKMTAQEANIFYRF